jgi:hypothetical protein
MVQKREWLVMSASQSFRKPNDQRAIESGFQGGRDEFEAVKT